MTQPEQDGEPVVCRVRSTPTGAEIIAPNGQMICSMGRKWIEKCDLPVPPEPEPPRTLVDELREAAAWWREPEDDPRNLTEADLLDAAADKLEGVSFDSDHPEPEPSLVDRQMTTPDDALIKWFRLAADYERARLDTDITEQTELALCRVTDFLEQPAQAYDPAARLRELEAERSEQREANIDPRRRNR